MHTFDCPFRLTPNGLTGFELVLRMEAAIELAQPKEAAKLSDIHTGPATRAKILVKKWKKRGYRPSHASDRGNRFISGCASADYGASKHPHMGLVMQSVIKKQDIKRNQRLASELMHRTLIVTNFNEHDTDLALPGPAESTEIVSNA
eukprot:5333491-Prymnesium_polylepis.2